MAEGWVRGNCLLMLKMLQLGIATGKNCDEAWKGFLSAICDFKIVECQIVTNCGYYRGVVFLELLF